jgi:hypothetical protein
VAFGPRANYQSNEMNSENLRSTMTTILCKKKCNLWWCIYRKGRSSNVIYTVEIIRENGYIHQYEEQRHFERMLQGILSVVWTSSVRSRHYLPWNAWCIINLWNSPPPPMTFLHFPIANNLIYKYTWNLSDSYNKWPLQNKNNNDNDKKGGGLWNALV